MTKQNALVEITCPDCGNEGHYALRLHDHPETPCPTTVRCRVCYSSLQVLTSINATVEMSTKCETDIALD